MAITGFALVVAVSLGVGCSGGLPTADAVDSAPTSEASINVEPVGFATVAVILHTPPADPLTLQVLLAESSDQRQRGLTGVTDLGDAEGMLFAFDTEAHYRFYMWQTLMPLDIVFFDTSGDFVGSAEMTPCLRLTADSCGRYSPDAAFLTALELPAGSIEELRLGPGSSITIVDEPPISIAPIAPIATASS